jgi:hypothetical protein
VIYLLAYGLVAPIFGLAIDNAAHIGGLAGGFLVGYIAGTPGFRPAVERLWQVVAAGALLLTAWSFLKMFLELVAIKSQ